VFKDESIRNMMINILFIYCKEHLSLSYRQVSQKMENYNSCLSSFNNKKHHVFHEFIISCKEHQTKIMTFTNKLFQR
jgi:uridine kinase